MLILGPVLGQISAGTIRILVETDDLCVLRITAECPNKTVPIVSCLVTTRAFRPVVAILRGLFSNCHYKYSIANIEDGNVLFSSSFYVPHIDKKLEVLVVSCNAIHMLKKDDVDLWDYMNNNDLEEGNTIDLLLHIGDQIYEYAEDTYERCENIFSCRQGNGGRMKGQDIINAEKKMGYGLKHHVNDPEKVYTSQDISDLFTEMYRNIYRKYWSHPSLKAVLAKVSNQMIADDHDFRNGWGILPQDREPGTEKYIIGNSAHVAYQEYQVQLWRDIDYLHRIDHRVLRRRSTAIFLMDVRTPRTFIYTEKRPYIGEKQHKDLQDTLADPCIDKLLLVCSIPILMSSVELTTIFEKIDVTEDIRDGWTTTTNKGDHFEILNMLKKWKNAKEGRSLLLVGGDIHFLLESVLEDEMGNEIGKQIVTSPMTNTPTNNFVGLLQDLFTQGSFSIYKGQFRVRHTNKKHRRNYIKIIEDPFILDYEACVANY